jgi:chromosome segregation ATPase
VGTVPSKMAGKETRAKAPRKSHNYKEKLSDKRDARKTRKAYRYAKLKRKGEDKDDNPRARIRRGRETNQDPIVLFVKEFMAKLREEKTLLTSLLENPYGENAPALQERQKIIDAAIRDGKLAQDNAAHYPSTAIDTVSAYQKQLDDNRKASDDQYAELYKNLVDRPEGTFSSVTDEEEEERLRINAENLKKRAETMDKQNKEWSEKFQSLRETDDVHSFIRQIEDEYGPSDNEDEDEEMKQAKEEEKKRKREAAEEKAKEKKKKHEEKKQKEEEKKRKRKEMTDKQMERIRKQKEDAEAQLAEVKASLDNMINQVEQDDKETEDKRGKLINELKERIEKMEKEREQGLMANAEERTREYNRHEAIANEEYEAEEREWKENWLKRATELLEMKKYVSDPPTSKKRNFSGDWDEDDPEIRALLGEVSEDEESEEEEEATPMEAQYTNQEQELETMRGEEEAQRGIDMESLETMVDGYSLEELRQQERETKKLERMLQIAHNDLYDKNEDVSKWSKKYKSAKEKADAKAKELQALEKSSDKLREYRLKRKEVVDKKREALDKANGSQRAKLVADIEKKRNAVEKKRMSQEKAGKDTVDKAFEKLKKKEEQLAKKRAMLDKKRKKDISTEDLEERVKEIGKIEKEAEDIRAALGKARDALHHLDDDKEYKMVQKEVEAAEKALAKHDKDIGKTDGELKSLMRLWKQADKALAKHLGDVSKLKSDHSAATKEMNEAKTTIKQLQDERDMIQNTAKEAIENLDSFMDDSEDKQIPFLSAIKNVETRLKRLMKSKDELKKRMDKQREMIKDFDKYPDKMKGNKRSYKKEVLALQDMNEEAIRIKESIARGKDTVVKLRTQKRAADNLVKSKIDLALLTLEPRMDTSDPENPHPQKRMARYKKELEKIKKELTSTMQKMEGLNANEEEYQKLQEKIDTLKARALTYNNAIDQTEGELRKNLYKNNDLFKSTEQWYGPKFEFDPSKPKEQREELKYQKERKKYEGNNKRIEALQDELKSKNTDHMTAEQREELLPKYQELERLWGENRMLLTNKRTMDVMRERRIDKLEKIAEETIQATLKKVTQKNEQGAINKDVDWQAIYSTVFEVQALLYRKEGDDPHDDKWMTSLDKKVKELQKLGTMATQFPNFVVDGVTKMEALVNRQKALNEASKKYQKSGLNDDDERHYAYSQEFTEFVKKQKNMAQLEVKLHDNNMKREALAASNPMYIERVKDFQDMIREGRQRLHELMTEMQDDVSANGPMLMAQAKMIYDKFQAMIRGATPELIKEFEEALRSDIWQETQLQIDQMNKLSSKLYAQKGEELVRSSTNETLVDYLLDPLSFADGKKRQSLRNTKLGLTWSQTHQLVSLLQRQIDLRQKAILPVYKYLNTVDEGVDGGKFDLIITHLFPPAVVESKLRIYKLLSPEQRASVSNGPFVKALQSLIPDFDIENVDGNNYMDTVLKIQSGAEQYVSSIAAPAGLNMADIMVASEEIERNKSIIISQSDPSMDPALQIDPSLQKRQAEGAPPLDQDAGASPPDPFNGEIVNSTYNPIVQGQLTRDMIDDAKKQEFIKQEHQHAMLSLQSAPQPPYIPLHVNSSKFFFGKNDYQTLQSQFDSIRPLIPKTRVEDPSVVIGNVIAKYGKIFGIPHRLTRDWDHPALIQQEAIELQQLEKAYQTYTTTTDAAYNKAEEAAPQSAPAAAAPQREEPDLVTKAFQDSPTEQSVSVNNPTSIGEEVSDPLTKGVAHPRDFWSNYSGFNNVSK